MRIDADKLLQSITEEETINLLEELGCEKYKDHLNYIAFCGNVCHDGSNLSLIYFKDSKLFKCFSQCNCTYNIYTLIQKVKGYNFVESLKYVSEFIGREYEQVEINDEDLISDWKWIKKLKKKKYNYYEKNTELPKTILNQYIHMPNIKWYEDGILPKTQKEWGVFYDLKSNRICYAIYDEKNELISIKGRSFDDEEPKYLYFYQCNKSNILVGLNKTLQYILSNGKCLVFESYKSVLLAWQWGYKFAVSVEGGSISEWQYKELLKMNVEIIIGFDKGINNEILKDIKDRFKGKTNLSFIYDTKDLLDDKEAPVDKGEIIFSELYKGRFKVK